VIFGGAREETPVILRPVLWAEESVGFAGVAAIPRLRDRRLAGCSVLDTKDAAHI
jgi:hypothetical protein